MAKEINGENLTTTKSQPYNLQTILLPSSNYRVRETRWSSENDSRTRFSPLTHRNVTRRYTKHKDTVSLLFT